MTHNPESYENSAEIYFLLLMNPGTMYPTKDGKRLYILDPKTKELRFMDGEGFRDMDNDQLSDYIQKRIDESKKS